MWKNPTPAPSPCAPKPKLCRIFRPFLCRVLLLRQRVVNNLLGQDAGKTVTACCCLLCTRNPLQETTNQEPFHSNKYDRNSAAHYLSSSTHSLSVSSSEREQCRQCVCGGGGYGAGDSSPESGGKLQQKHVQMRRDGFVIRLKCQLLQKPVPGAALTDRRLELAIIPTKLSQL